MFKKKNNIEYIVEINTTKEVWDSLKKSIQGCAPNILFIPSGFSDAESSSIKVHKVC